MAILASGRPGSVQGKTATAYQERKPTGKGGSSSQVVANPTRLDANHFGIKSRKDFIPFAACKWLAMDQRLDFVDFPSPLQ
jgi:hypothetical protein